MITVEGMGDGRKVWVCWVPPKGLDIAESALTAYCPNVVRVSPVIPCSMTLPPPGNANVMIDVATSGYGSKLNSIEVGTLVSDNSASRQPKPCQHSTLTGTFVYLGPAGAVSPPMFRIGVTLQPGNVQRYTSDGNRVSFLAGRAASTSSMRAFNHLGVLVPIDYSSATQWSTNTFLYSDGVPADYPSSLLPYSRIHHSDYYWTKPPTQEATTAFFGERHLWEHVSDDVWEETWIQEYHSSSSYTPREPRSPSGYGYEVAYVERHRTHTLVSLQQSPQGKFTLLFSVDEKTKWRALGPGSPVPSHISGGVAGVYSYTVVCTVMTPGLCATWNVPPMDWHTYCVQAREKASMLYDENLMTIARSNAIADVKGLESNWIENLSQLKGTLDVVNPLLDGYKAVVHGDIYAAKSALAGALFAYMYTIKPTISDIKDLDNNLKPTVQGFTKYRFSNERRRGGTRSSRNVGETSADLIYHCVMHFQLKDNSFSVVWNALERLGLDPSVRNLWDLIPYSFVVDWFLSIGPALQKLSLYVSNVLTRDLKVRIQSYKVQWPLSRYECEAVFGRQLQVCGYVTYSWYDRRIAYHIGVVDPFAGQSLDGLSVSQTVQGAALLSNYIR